VLVHGDLHEGNVLLGKPGRGLIAIDPRACVGEAEFDAADWVYWRVAPDGWSERCRELAAALDLDRERLWAWAAALAPLNAAAIAARGGPSSEVAALLSTAP
jgi:streptomycin 6-kinase